MYRILDKKSSGSKARSGWKQAATVNCTVLVLMSVVLIVSLAVSSSRAGGLNKTFMFYNGECDGGSAAKVNVALHLLLNLVSTAVLASSTFFMQVLNAPSREEVDVAHAKGSWLGIGVPSVRNAFKVWNFKTVAWMVLLLTSIPIHLIFNSAIFETDRREADFHLTVAADGFLSGEPWFAPGGSLAISGLYDEAGYDNNFYHYQDPRYGSFPINNRDYGVWSNLSDYADPNAPVLTNITATVANAARWENISATQCQQEYVMCNGIKLHRDVVLVVDKPGGWQRDETWHLLPNQTSFWDDFGVPGSQSNSLWFSSQCAMVANYATRGVTCDNYCDGALGFPGSHPDEPIDVWQYDFFASNASLAYVNNTLPAEEEYGLYYGNITSGLVSSENTLRVKYCMAEPIDRVCHVGLSNTLLLAVTICVLVKTGTVIIITWIFLGHAHEPLVTLGDAIASFISRPDSMTVGMCLLGNTEARKELRKGDRLILPGPREWKPSPKRRSAAIPKSAWITSYVFFSFGVFVMLIPLAITVSSLGWLQASFLESDSNPFSNIPFNLTQAVLIANSPQLMLSFCYLAYNNLFTRLQMAKEWARLSEDYHPLRVTNPKGEQYATYRLQLPYKYSVPLICVSIGLHWLLSNTIYVFVSEGGYYGTLRFIAAGIVRDPTLPANTAVAVGFSAKSLFTMFMICLGLLFLPIVLGRTKLPTNTIIVGSNSLAIAAACHASTLHVAPGGDGAGGELSKKPSMSSMSSSSTWRLFLPASPSKTMKTLSSLRSWDESTEYNGAAGYAAMGGSDMATQDEPHETLVTGEPIELEQPWGRNEALVRLSQGRLKWGVVRMPDYWYQELEFTSELLSEHIGLGSVGQNVTPSVPGAWYS